MSPAHIQRRADEMTSSLIDIGVLYHRTLGERIARAYFEELRVPEIVVRRVLGGGAQRRRTVTDDWSPDAG
jgi:hypothetical protein